jgi:hypothetical protein
VLGGERDRAVMAAAEQLRLAVLAALPDGADGVDDVLDRQPAGAGDLRVAGVAAAQRAALLQQLRSGGAVDRTVDPPAAAQAGVGRVDDRVGLGVLGDVAAVQRYDSHGFVV